MLKDPAKLKQTLLDFLKSELVASGKDGIVVHLDGTLMSLVNLHLAQELSQPFSYKVVVCTFYQNRFDLKQLTTIIKDFNIVVEVSDLEKDFETLSFYKLSEGDPQLEIAIKKRFIDLMLNVQADKNNLVPVSNLCYSQWCVNFPHANYKNREHIHLLNRLYYSEIVELAKYLQIRDLLINREPSHYLYVNQSDKVSLGFTYNEQESFLRDPQIKSLTGRIIQQKVVPDDMHKYRSTFLVRPSNLLG